MLKSFLQHKMGCIEFSPTKQEHELIKEDWADKNHNDFSQRIKQEKIMKYFRTNNYNTFFTIIMKNCGKKGKFSRNG